MPQGLRNKGARKQREIEVMLGTLFKLLVKDKLLHNGKAPVNAELRPLRKEKQGTAVQRYSTLNEATRFDAITFNFYRTATHVFLQPSFIPVLSLPKGDWTQQYLKNTM